MAAAATATATEHSNLNFEIKAVPVTDEEQSAAKAYWADRDFRYYTRPKPWSHFMAERILEFKPASVLEFGCNAGKNLAILKSVAPDLFMAGIDINHEAIEFGRASGLRVLAGDENALAIMPENAFDVVFTVSVIDHIATPDRVVVELARITRKALLLLEPWLGEEGKVIRNADQKTGELIDTTPFSYSWDYSRIVSEQLPGWQLREEAFSMASNLGRYYRLYTISPATG